ncbi:alpha-adducin-like isoform X3 [Lineus longissimus]|uniref:alpha-adducin-like isoform X3 n=1 Tax=Lineus longissimus TaxID=88925 RepID=UPI00315D925A
MTEEAQVNGPSGDGGKFIDTIDPEDPEYIRQLRRPAEIKEDVRQMEQRKRVSLILNSEAFREELEAIIESQIKSGPHPASLIALQQISELLLPNARSSGGVGKGGVSSSVVPVADIRGVDSLSYTKAEKNLRNKVASCYRLVDLFGWTHNIYNHITARLSQDTEHFLINPFGLLYHEVTASSLVKLDMQGEVLNAGTTSFGINKAGYMIHSVIHAARPDIKAIIHLHTPAVVAISCMKCGLLPISQESLICGDLSYHDYHGIVVDEDERESLGKDLGPVNKIMFLRNHGVLCCGENIEEAFYLAMNLVAACETQMRLLPIGLDNIVQVDDATKQKVQETVKTGGGGVDMKSQGGRKWKIGEMEFEALMRLLDNAGYRTGFQYRQLVERIEPGKGKSTSDVEIPPTSSSHMNDDDVSSPLKVALERQKKHVKTEWLGTPNTYSKKEIDETGTPNPKKITKWVQDGSPQKTSTPIKVDTKNQFAPIGDNPAEFKKHQKKVRENYYKDTRTAGPQSKILEGTTWEEASRMRDGNLSGAGDIVVGAASKGIIQREHQHNAVVYKQYYAANPFESMTDDEIQKYKADIDRKNHPEGDAGFEVEGEVEGEVQLATTIGDIEQTPPVQEEWGFTCPSASNEDILAHPVMPRKHSRATEQEDEVNEVARPLSMIQVERARTFAVYDENDDSLAPLGKLHSVGSAPASLERDVHPGWKKEKPPPPKRTVTLGKYKPLRPDLPLPFRRTKTLQPTSRRERPPVPPRPRPFSGEFFIADFPAKAPPARPEPPVVLEEAAENPPELLEKPTLKPPKPPVAEKPARRPHVVSEELSPEYHVMWEKPAPKHHVYPEQPEASDREGVMNGDEHEEKPKSPTKSDTLKSQESGEGDTSHADGSPTKDKKKKGGKFRMPSFGKKRK